MSHGPDWTTPAGTIGTYPSQVEMSFTFSATAISPGTAVTYTVLSGSIPSGLVLNTTTGVLSGVPSTIGGDTVYNFAIRAFDNQVGTDQTIADRTFSVEISGVAAPTFTTPTGTILNTNDSVWREIQIEISNPVTTNAYSIRVAQGKLPPGLEINTQGLIRGYADAPIINVNYPLVTTSALAISSNIIQVLSTTGFILERPINFSGTVYGDIVAGRTYFIKTIIDATTFTISDSRGGSEVVLVDAVGNMTASLPQIQVGQPTVQTYSFTLGLDSLLGTAIESYIIVVANQNASSSEGGPGYPGNSRTPTIFNTRPATFDVGKNDPTNYGYYVFPNDNENTTYLPAQPADIGQYQSGEYFAFKMLGKDFDGDALTYLYADLPLGIVGDPVTGWITGYPTIAEGISEFSFSVNVRKSSFTNVSSTTFNYSMRVTNGILGTVTWITPTALGTMFNSQTSVLAVSATADVDLSFRVTSGALPSNLVLLDSGEISGIVAYQPTVGILPANAETSFDFTIEAYSPIYPIVHSTKEFTLEIKQEFSQPTDTLYIKCVPSIADRNIINQLLTSTTIIPSADLYRAEDVNFGKSTSIVYEHAYGIYASDFDEYVIALEKNHYWRNITLGEIKTAVAKNNAGDVVYEVVYSQVQDNLVNPKGKSVSKTITWPRDIPINLGNWYTSATDIYSSYVGEGTVAGQPAYFTSLTPGFARTLYPNSLDNMRAQTGDVLGQEYDFRLLPAWMTSQQPNGSTLGYTPAWVIAYCQPGTSAQIKTNVETLWVDPIGNPYTLNTINFELDRITVDKSITYDYDNNVAPPAWTGLPSASPPPSPTDSKDFHVLFPRKTILPDEKNVSG